MHTGASRLQRLASARHPWASGLRVADRAPLTWSLLRVPAYQESRCLPLLSSPFSHCGAWLILARICWRAHFRVIVCTSQQWLCWERWKMLYHAFIDVDRMSVHSQLYIKDTSGWQCDKSWKVVARAPAASAGFLLNSVGRLVATRCRRKPQSVHVLYEGDQVMLATSVCMSDHLKIKSAQEKVQFTPFVQIKLVYFY